LDFARGTTLKKITFAAIVGIAVVGCSDFTEQQGIARPEQVSAVREGDEVQYTKLTAAAGAVALAGTVTLASVIGSDSSDVNSGVSSQPTFASSISPDSTASKAKIETGTPAAANASDSNRLASPSGIVAAPQPSVPPNLSTVDTPLNNLALAPVTSTQSAPVAVAAPQPRVGAANTITLTEKAGQTVLNYPLQFGRIFAKGEMRNEPVLLNGSQTIETQVDTKNRWEDGSLKFAIISAIVPRISAGQKITLSFGSQQVKNNVTMRHDQLLSAVETITPTISLTNGGTSVTSQASTLVRSNSYTRWIDGPVSTSIIVSDHSGARSGDLGFNANRAFRPSYHITWWPQIGKAFVRFVGEISNTEVLEDVTYDLQLKAGPQQTLIYEKTAFKHRVGTRWSRTTWVGGAPSPLDVDLNLAYLSSTGSIPNYDSSIQLASNAMQTMIDSWGRAPRGIGDGGLLNKGMPGAGGRAEIGIMPTWSTYWLYSGDERMREIVLGNADLGASWPMHFREGNNLKRNQVDNTVPPIGRPVNLFSRPTLWFAKWNLALSNDAILLDDRLKFVGPYEKPDYGQWLHDGAHQPDLYSVPYMLTGQFWYLEQLQFWAAWGTMANAPISSLNYGRGPTNLSGFASDEVRGEAWLFRTRAFAAYLSPDNTPEKQTFTRTTESQIRIWEGVRDIQNPSNIGSSEYIWGRDMARSNSYGTAGVGTLRQWSSGVTGYAPQGPIFNRADGYNLSITNSAAAPWMHNYIVMSLGVARDLGFDTTHLLKWAAQGAADASRAFAGAPWLVGLYTLPTLKNDGGRIRWFNDWNEIKTAYSNPNYLTSTGTDGVMYDFRLWVSAMGNASLEHGYPLLSAAATSYIGTALTPIELQTFYDKEVRQAAAFSLNPKWAIRPR
jgi:hypothetical protein